MSARRLLSQAVVAGCCCRLLSQAVVAGCCCRLLLQAVVAGCCCRLLLQAVVAGCCCWLLLQAVVAGCCCWLLLLAVVRPTLEYGSEVWEANKTQAAVLESVMLGGVKHLFMGVRLRHVMKPLGGIWGLIRYKGVGIRIS